MREERDSEEGEVGQVDVDEECHHFGRARRPRSMRVSSSWSRSLISHKDKGGIIGILLPPRLDPSLPFHALPLAVSLLLEPKSSSRAAQFAPECQKWRYSSTSNSLSWPR